MSLQTDIDRGLVLVKLIAELQAELDEITERIEAAGLAGPHVPLEDKAREGRQFLGAGSNVILPVVITADSLVQSFPDGSPIHDTIKAAAGDHFGQFYRPSNKWETRQKDGQKFRELAATVMGKTAPAFITACLAKDKLGIPKNKLVIAWDRAEELPAEQAATEAPATTEEAA